MPDREKVIRGLEICLNTGSYEECVKDCPYFPKLFGNGVCSDALKRDALALLKQPKRYGKYVFITDHKDVEEVKRLLKPGIVDDLETLGLLKWHFHDLPEPEKRTPLDGDYPTLGWTLDLTNVQVGPGRWIKANNPNYSPFDNSRPYILTCSNCGYAGGREGFRYCPKCGKEIPPDESFIVEGKKDG